MQGAPKYARITLTWKDGKTDTFEDVGMVVTADKVIIVKDTHDSVNNEQKSEGSVFELSDMVSYATYKKQTK